MKPPSIISRALFFMMGLIILISTGCSEPKAQEQSRPNIILFVADDHGTDALGCYGNPIIETPHLDKLAAEGVRFTHAYCTSASCAASRSVILTGIWQVHGYAGGQWEIGEYHRYLYF